MKREQGPEDKYVPQSPTSGFLIGRIRAPLAEGAVDVRACSFSTRPRLRFKIGDKLSLSNLSREYEAANDKPSPHYRPAIGEPGKMAPFRCDEERFDIIIGRLGKYTGNSDIAFLDDKARITALMREVVEDLRRSLIESEKRYGGAEGLLKRQREYQAVRMRQIRSHDPPPIQAKDGKELRAAIKMRAEARQLGFDFAMKGYGFPREPAFIDRRADQEFGKAADALNALMELESKAMEIYNICHWLENFGAARFAVAFPDSFKSISPVALVLHGYQDRSGPDHYDLAGDVVGLSEYHRNVTGNLSTIFLGNQATVTVGPLVER
jgi:hypothetical protein